MHGFPKSDLQQFIAESDGGGSINDLLMTGNESRNDCWLWDALKSLVCRGYMFNFDQNFILPPDYNLLIPLILAQVSDTIL